MVREVLTLSVGQCGIQLGHCIWMQYCAEHEISSTGEQKEEEEEKEQKQEKDDSSFQVFFNETNAGLYIPRNISIDLEPNVIDDVKNSDYGAIFDEEYLINGKEDAANNFARGMFTVGRDIIDKVNDKIRKQVDKCDFLQGFAINHSVGGGTGSGLGSLILEHLSREYRKKSKFGFEVYPSPTLSNCVVEPYNALLTTHYLLDNTEVSILLDNEALYEICQKQLDLNRKNKKQPSHNNINRLISKMVSSITASLRFKSDLSVDLTDFQTNLVPFPRLHFMTTSLSPITTKAKKETYKADVKSITEQCFQPKNFFVKLADFEPEEDKYMAILLNYRGNVKPKEANAALQWIKANKKVFLVDWVPTGFKLGLTDESACLVEGDDVALFDKNATMIGNNSAISRVFSERICKKFDKMYSQRAYVHWYVGEGMEEGDFGEARENLAYLEKDFLDVLNEETTDENAENDDDDDDDDDEDY